MTVSAPWCSGRLQAQDAWQPMGATPAAPLAYGGDEQPSFGAGPAAFLPLTTELIRRELGLD